MLQNYKRLIILGVVLIVVLAVLLSSQAVTIQSGPQK